MNKILFCIYVFSYYDFFIIILKYILEKKVTKLEHNLRPLALSLYIYVYILSSDRLLSQP